MSLNPFNSLYGTLGIIIGGYVLVRLAFEIYDAIVFNRRYWPSKSTEQIEMELFTVHEEYFATIGLENVAASELRRLVASRDLEGLRKRWAPLSKEVIKLERKAGLRGRPHLYDYYYDCSRAAAELLRRRAVAGQ